MKKAVGTFDVKINPLPPYNTSEEAKLARMFSPAQCRSSSTREIIRMSSNTVFPVARKS